jgi:hypothetical protein
MIPFLTGAAIVAVTLVAFWRCLPRDGRPAPFVGTEWEAYVAITVAFGIAMGLGFMALGVGEMLGVA